MSKITIDFMIKSTDSEQEFTTVGNIDGNQISFIDPEKEQHKITLHNKIVEYHKSGTSNLHFIFDTQNQTVGIYSAYNQVFEFIVQTKQCINTNNHINIKYQLYQEDELVNETSLTLYYDFVKEE